MGSSGKKFTRSTGAESGSESYAIAFGLVIMWTPLVGVRGVLALLAGLLALQLAVARSPDLWILYYACASQKSGPAVMRNGSIGFAECVKPGGKPTKEHCLEMYNYPPWLTSLIFVPAALGLLCIGPVLSFVRVFYPENLAGVNKNDKLRLFLFFLRHPVAIQGEGPSNGDGLAAMGASESVIYPITRRSLEPGPPGPYWKEEGRPRLRDMFHDKLFCHRFFEEYGVQHPKLVAEVVGHKRTQVFLEPGKAPAKLVWKARYSTMGLGVEKFAGWAGVDTPGWAPSSVPFVLEEFIESTEYEASEWYRMTTLWAFDEAAPKPGYIWRTRNKPDDPRVQTDIIGGAYCITRDHVPYVGPQDVGQAVDPRTGAVTPLDARVERALAKGVAKQLEMHKALGQELYTIGWDVMVRGDEPVFIEFNINNGFFVGDHTLEEVEQMTAYYGKEYAARLPGQLLNFDPYAEPNGVSEARKKR